METSTKHVAKKRFKTFRDLFAQQAQAIAYQVSLSSVNVCTHIAKGFSQQDYADKELSYGAASGSLAELENLLVVAQGTGHISAVRHDDLLRRCTNTYWMLA